MCHPGLGTMGQKEARDPTACWALSPVPSPAQHLFPAPSAASVNTYHVKHVGHKHLHVHDQGGAPIVWNLDGFLNLLGPVGVEVGWPG